MAALQIFPAPALQYQGAVLDSVLIKQDDHCAIYNLRNAGGFTQFTAYVTRDSGTSLQDLQLVCRNLSALYPLNKLAYQGEHDHLMALIYSPFTTLRHYLRGDPNRASEPTFVEVMRGLINCLNNVHRERHTGLGSQFAVVKDEDNQGSVVLLSNVTGHRTQQHLCADFKRVGNLISSECAGINLPRDLRTLLRCFRWATSTQMCKRFIYAPLFYSEFDRVAVYIPKICAALWSTPAYRLEAEKYIIHGGAVSKVCLHQNSEAGRIWNKGGRKSIRNHFQLCQLARNMAVHVNEEVRGISVLISHPWVFLGLLDDISYDFLNKLFEASYTASLSTIQMLDMH